MTKILQLDDFFLTKLQIDWYPVAPSEEGSPVSVETEISVSYEVLRNQEQTGSFILKLLFAHHPSKKKGKKGLALSAEIVGLFHFPEGVPEEEMQRLIRINGGTILYGILRGEIASLTGSFPSGKFVLPTVSIPEIVETIERQRRTELDNRPVKPTTRTRRVKKAKTA